MPSQTLALSQSQQLQMILAPQLRQSLEMLQVPILELRTLIQRELEQNPTLEEVPPEAERLEVSDEMSAPDDGKELDFDREFEVLSKLDEEWREYFFQDQQYHPYTPEDEEKRKYFFDSLTRKESLQEHLLRQLHLTELSEENLKLGELLVGSLDDDGYLRTPLEELASSAGVESARLADVLEVIHDLDPPGVGARDLRECLLLQLDRLGHGESLAANIVRHHMDELAARRFSDIAAALHVTPDKVQEAAKLIATLDPKPGRTYSGETAAYIEPEVIIEKVNGEYVVVLNDDPLPHLRISKQYRDLLNDPNMPPEVKSYVRERIRSGTFLMKSIHQRQRTIHRIATEIVRVQKDFLGHGITHLKPLTMAEIARAVGVHETTVSRAVAGKYVKTPQGTFEMKFFFTPGIRTADGQAVSNKTVKDMIAHMIATEDPDHPLSDQEIAQQLREKGIHIARRTVAKYRLFLRIAPSHLRKQY